MLRLLGPTTENFLTRRCAGTLHKISFRKALRQPLLKIDYAMMRLMCRGQIPGAPSPCRHSQPHLRARRRGGPWGPAGCKRRGSPHRGGTPRTRSGHIEDHTRDIDFCQPVACCIAMQGCCIVVSGDRATERYLVSVRRQERFASPREGTRLTGCHLVTPQ